MKFSLLSFNFSFVKQLLSLNYFAALQALKKFLEGSSTLLCKVVSTELKALLIVYKVMLEC